MADLRELELAVDELVKQTKEANRLLSIIGRALEKIANTPRDAAPKVGYYDNGRNHDPR